jgi:hypothetical protein
MMRKLFAERTGTADDLPREDADPVSVMPAEDCRDDLDSNVWKRR